jgi:8-amino-7-oxononanoate synthase
VTGPWPAFVEGRLASISAAGRLRTIRPLDGNGPVVTLADGRPVVSFASNDYLGLSQHPSVRLAAVEAIERWGTGSGSARLVVGDRPPHRALEAALAEWKGCEAALLFPTGFAANLGVLGVVGGQADALIVTDELNHASIVDGCRLARATVAVSRHCDTAHVDALLAAHDGPGVVVTDTVFSMDGDVALLEALAAVCVARGALLVLDEAHAVLGPSFSPPPDLSLLRVGTLSKTLGSLGGFVAGPRSFIDLILNAARPFIFTTAPSPADTAAALAALSVLQSSAGTALCDRLRALVDRVAPGHPSPIVPVIVGSEDDALRASARLLEDFGLLVPAIRPPTVPPGTSRLRVALSAAHTDDHVARLEKALF